jgi:hypothetical protein
MLALSLILCVAAAPQARPTTPFTQIAAGGSFLVKVVAGDQPALAVDAEDAADDVLVETKVEKEVLHIGCSRQPCNFKKKVTVLVTAASLERVSAGGSGAVIVTDVPSKKLQLNGGGSGDIEWRGTAEEIQLNLGGSGKGTLIGKANKLEVAIGGSAEADAFGLEVQDAKVSIGGSGRALVHAVHDLSAVVTGSGKVVYLGTPRVKKTISGSGRVEPKDAPTKAAAGGW